MTLLHCLSALNEICILILVGVMLRDVIRVHSDDEAPKKSSKSKSQKVKKVKREVVAGIEQPPTEIKVVTYVTQEEEYQSTFILFDCFFDCFFVEIAVTSEMLELGRTVGAGEYSFQKVFNEGEFLATGVLELPRGATKPSKNSHSSAMVY